MYNGIGLRSASGSGTNGYVQKNLSFLKPKKGGGSSSGKAPYEFKYGEESSKAQPPRKPSDEVLLHKSRRMVEVEVLEYREDLEAKRK
jgi:serine/arginine repetitive matrix protein 2